MTSSIAPQSFSFVPFVSAAAFFRNAQAVCSHTRKGHYSGTSVDSGWSYCKDCHKEW